MSRFVWCAIQLAVFCAVTYAMLPSGQPLEVIQDPVRLQAEQHEVGSAFFGGFIVTLVFATLTLWVPVWWRKLRGAEKRITALGEQANNLGSYGGGIVAPSKLPQSGEAVWLKKQVGKRVGLTTETPSRQRLPR